MKKTLVEITNELKQTTWTKPRELLSLLVYTIAICGIIALSAFGLDSVFNWVRDQIL